MNKYQNQSNIKLLVLFGQKKKKKKLLVLWTTYTERKNYRKHPKTYQNYQQVGFDTKDRKYFKFNQCLGLGPSGGGASQIGLDSLGALDNGVLPELAGQNQLHRPLESPSTSASSAPCT